MSCTKCPIKLMFLWHSVFFSQINRRHGKYCKTQIFCTHSIISEFRELQKNRENKYPQKLTLSTKIKHALKGH